MAPLINMFLECNLSDLSFDEVESTRFLISQKSTLVYNDFWHISDSNVMV